MNTVPTIAIIDDDRPLRMALDNLIRAAGYQTQLFASAEDYLGSPALDAIDLVITDFAMTGANGIELTTALRVRGDRVPVILITALVEDGMEQRSYAAGARACLQKPFDEPTLFAAIEDALRDAH